MVKINLSKIRVDWKILKVSHKKDLDLVNQDDYRMKYFIN